MLEFLCLNAHTQVWWYYFWQLKTLWKWWKHSVHWGINLLPPEKIHSPLSSNPLLKVEVLPSPTAPPLLLKIWLEVQPTPHPPAEKGRGMPTVEKCSFISPRNLIFCLNFLVIFRKKRLIITWETFYWKIIHKMWRRNYSQALF